MCSSEQDHHGTIFHEQYFQNTLTFFQLTAYSLLNLPYLLFPFFLLLHPQLLDYKPTQRCVILVFPYKLILTCHKGTITQFNFPRTQLQKNNDKNKSFCHILSFFCIFHRHGSFPQTKPTPKPAYHSAQPVPFSIEAHAPAWMFLKQTNYSLDHFEFVIMLQLGCF